MIAIIIPLVVLVAIILIKKIPFVGGKVAPALLIAGVLVIILSGDALDFSVWIGSVAEGLDRFLWIILFCVLVNIYAQCQMKLGVIEGVMRILKSIFGSRGRALLTATFIALIFTGAFTGSTSACVMIIGVFVAKALYEQGLSKEKVAATLVMGSVLGSLMPPISFAINTASGIMDTDVVPALSYGYLIAAAAAVLVYVYVVFIFGSPKSLEHDRMGGLAMTGTPEEREKVGDIIREIGWGFLPIILLVVIIILNNGFKINIPGMTLGLLTKPLADVRILKALTNFLVLTFTIICAICFLFKKVRNDAKEVIVTGAKRGFPVMIILASAGFMVGAFVVTGKLQLIEELATSLNSNALIIGGAFCLMLIGMLTGSDGTALSVVLPFYGPALLGLGIDPTRATVAGAVFGVAGQGLPPADTCAFLVCGTLIALLGVKEVNPMKVMLLCMPLNIILVIIGFFLIYV